MLANTFINYPVLTILSIGKKSFENLGRLINKSGDTIKRILNPGAISLFLAQKIAQEMFKNSETIFLAIDDTLIKKIYSRFMAGSGKFYDTKICRTVTAYKLIAAMITDGKYIVPISCEFMFSKEVLSELDAVKSKTDLIKQFYLLAQNLFPGKRIVIVADGLFATTETLQWCANENINCEMRMHSNRVVEYDGKKLKLLNIESLKLRGRQMARTIKVLWHDINLYVTSEKRIDKHGEESIVFLVSTYKAKPREHVKTYKKRWPIEKVFRTTKQSLGLQECFSTRLKTQYDHVCGVFLAYALVQWEMKKRKSGTPEDVIRALKRKKYQNLLDRFSSLDQIFGDIHA